MNISNIQARVVKFAKLRDWSDSMDVIEEKISICYIRFKVLISF